MSHQPPGAAPVIRHVQQLVLDRQPIPIDEAGCRQLTELLGNRGPLRATSAATLTEEGEILLVLEGGYEISLSPRSLTVAIDWRYESAAASARVLQACLCELRTLAPGWVTPQQGVRMLYGLPLSPARAARVFRPEVSAWATSSMLGEDRTDQWESTARFTGEADSLINGIVVRSGYYPQGLDLELARPHDAGTPTFLLDIDVDAIRERPCEPEEIVCLIRTLSERVQSLFAASHRSCSPEES